jgi:hypothetical protein
MDTSAVEVSLLPHDCGDAGDGADGSQAIATLGFERLSHLHARADATTLRSSFDAALLRHGAILIRKLPVAQPRELEEVLAWLIDAGEFVDYEEDRVSPRTKLGERTYSSTDYKPSQDIFFHNECCTRLSWPARIAFYCKTPAPMGGQTPIASVRAITRHIPGKLIDEFKSKRLKYVRNLGGKYGMPLPYAFGTTDREVIADYCQRNDMKIDWLGDDRARLTLWRPPLAAHPQSGETLWFNNVAFWSRQNWDRALQKVLRGVPDAELAFHTSFGDGTDIQEAAHLAIRRAYESSAAHFDWEAGDLLILDNMLYAHGRTRFAGAREVWTIMAREVRRDPQGANAHCA